jgi:hypothetical protein
MADLLGLVGSLTQICLDLGGVAQIIADHGIDIGELQGRILLSDLFGGRPVGKCQNDCIQGNARLSNSHHTICIYL